MSQHTVFVVSKTLIVSYFISCLCVSSIALAWSNSITFWWIVQTQTECVLADPTRTDHLGCSIQNFEKPVLHQDTQIWMMNIVHWDFEIKAFFCMYMIVDVLTSSFFPGKIQGTCHFGKSVFTILIIFSFKILPFLSCGMVLFLLPDF